MFSQQKKSLPQQPPILHCLKNKESGIFKSLYFSWIIYDRSSILFVYTFFFLLAKTFFVWRNACKEFHFFSIYIYDLYTCSYKSCGNAHCMFLTQHKAKSKSKSVFSCCNIHLNDVCRQILMPTVITSVHSSVKIRDRQTTFSWRKTICFHHLENLFGQWSKHVDLSLKLRSWVFFYLYLCLKECAVKIHVHGNKGKWIDLFIFIASVCLSLWLKRIPLNC